MPEFRITSSKVHPGIKMLKGAWHFLRARGNPARLLHKFDSIVYEFWTGEPLFADGSNRMRSGSVLRAYWVTANAKGGMTPEGGFAIKLINNTGAPSVKGQLVEADSVDENSYKKADASATDTIGIVYETGVPDGVSTWIVTGGIADVLLDAGGCVHHDRLVSSATAGSADVANAPAVALHFQEIGHALETAAGGELAKTALHFL